jgi:hypothetical protein
VPDDALVEPAALVLDAPLDDELFDDELPQPVIAIAAQTAVAVRSPLLIERETVATPASRGRACEPLA